MWVGTAIHVATSYLDPSLKSFSFIKDVKERKGLLAQAEEAVRENAMSYSGILVTDDSDCSDIEDCTTGEQSDREDDVVSKKAKYDPFSEFRNVVTGNPKRNVAQDALQGL